MNLGARLSQIRESGKVPIIIFILVIQIILVILIASFVNNFQNDKSKNVIPATEINNLQIPNLPKQVSGLIESALYQAINLNSDNQSTVSAHGASMRENSLHQNDISETGLHTVTFIVDILDTQQSYGAYFEWTDQSMTSDNDMIYCLGKEQNIDKNFVCKDAYAGKGEELIVQNLVKKYPFKNISVTSNHDVSGVTLTAYIKDSGYTANEAKDQIRAFIQMFGFDPDRYKIVVPDYGYTNIISSQNQ